MVAPDRDALRAELERTSAVLRDRAFDVSRFVFDRPATESQVERLEDSIAVPLPASFRQTLLSVSRHVEFRWFTPDDVRFAPPFHENFSGDLHWSLKFTRQSEQQRRSWVEEVFPDPSNPYDAVWHNKLAFAAIGNGDLLALDLAAATAGAIVYLSHEDGEGHGFTLASDFADLVRRWVPLACPGGEDWQWLPFTSSPRSGIDPDSPNGLLWQEILGLR
jgi:hypothetical protein